MIEEIDAVLFTRWFLAVFFLSVAAFYTIRILAVKGRTGRSPVTLGRAGSRHFFVQVSFRVFRLLIAGVAVVRLIRPEIDALLVPIQPLWQPWILLAGDLLLLVALGGVLYVQAYMASDWRSGIPLSESGTLMTTGPFARTRNPMFVAVQFGQLGFFLALPSLFSLLCLIAGVIAIQAQVRLEEAHLEERHGAAYVGYASRTPRWLLRPRPAGKRGKWWAVLGLNQ